MSVVRDLSGNNPIDRKYSPYNRTAADLTAVLALSGLYPGEIVEALNTGRKYRWLGAVWGLIGPVTSVVAGTLPQPSVTINQAAGQTDPTSVSPISFTVVFSQDVIGFATGDVTFTTSSAGGTLVGTVIGGPNTYTVQVTGMTTAGSVAVQVPAGVATGPGGLNTASVSTDNIVGWQPDVTPPSVTINQGASQADPTSGSSIVFDVVFSEPVIAISSGSITVAFGCGGTPSVAVAAIDSSHYTVTITGMATTNGTVTASIAAGVTTDAASLPNTASTSTDNVVTWNGAGGGGGFPDSTTSANELPILFI